MNKEYPKAQIENATVSEPVTAYGIRSDYRAPAKNTSTRECVMASTVSVDEYFDELISQVRADYANL